MSSKVDQLVLSDYHFLRVCHSCLEGEDQCSRSKQKSFHRPRARKRCLICLFASRSLQTACSRSEERRVGKECVSTCRSRRSPSHSKKYYDRTQHTHKFETQQRQ